MKLNLGCGKVKRKGFVNVDCVPEIKPDVVGDVEETLPFPDDSFDYIYSRMVLEHIRPYKWRDCLDEIYRVAKHNCIFHVIVPYDNKGERTSGDHYRTFNFYSFNAFDEDNYYVKLRLERITKVSWLKQVYYWLTPFFRHELDLKFRIIKEAGK